MTFEEFVAARLPGLLRYAAVLTGDRHLASDVVQEVLARAHVRWPAISRSASPEAYVRRMVLNEYLSWRRAWATRDVRAVGERLVETVDGTRAGRDHAPTWSRRTSSGPTVDSPTRQQLQQAAAGLTKFFDVNLTAVLADAPARDTLEVRVLPGALSAGALLAGADLVQALLDRCLDPSPLPTGAALEGLLRSG